MRRCIIHCYNNIILEITTRNDCAAFFYRLDVNRYFQLMEAWQENLAERQQLMGMAGKPCLFKQFSLSGLDAVTCQLSGVKQKYEIKNTLMLNSSSFHSSSPSETSWYMITVKPHQEGIGNVDIWSTAFANIELTYMIQTFWEHF